MDTKDWMRLLPDEDFRPRMGLRSGDAHRFFRSSTEPLLRIRGESLDRAAEKYSAATQEGLPWVIEAVTHMAGWADSLQTTDFPSDVLTLCDWAGRRIEADWVLLSPDATQHHPVSAGVVCFPSSWSLSAKLGRHMSAVHEPVPALNQRLGNSIDSFLACLEPSAAWERDNWGLCSSPQLDQHPDNASSPLLSTATLSSTWLRWEHQLLIRLPETRSILFGIRVTTHRLDELIEIPGVAERLIRALRTMPDTMATYKGLSHCRCNLIDQLAQETQRAAGKSHTQSPL